MALKSTFGKIKKAKSSKAKIPKSKPVKSLITGGITALLGVALLSETASVLRRL